MYAARVPASLHRLPVSRRGPFVLRAATVAPATLVVFRSGHERFILSRLILLARSLASNRKPPGS